MTELETNLFYGSLVKLTGPREEDAEIMVQWEEDYEYLRNIDTDVAIPKTKEKFENAPDGKEPYFRLRTIDGDELIGFVVIHSIEWNNRSGLLAIGIGGAENRGKGYGTDALRVILRYAFRELNLDRVGLDVIDYNHRAIKAYERVGFKHEGAMRSAVFRDGKKYDRVIMGILREEWEELNRT